MLQWKKLPSDVVIPSVNVLFRQLDCISVISAITNFFIGKRIYVTDKCAETFSRHAQEQRTETGGILLGEVYEVAKSVADGYPYLTIATKAIPSRNSQSSSVSLAMSTEVWNEAASQLSDGLIVIGWYHTHPNLGAFFSGTDRSTQMAFFNHQYQCR